MRFVTHRRALINPDVELEMLAHLLWHNEAASLLADKGFPAGLLRKPRRELYTLIAAHMTLNELTRSIKDFMKQRPAWRDRPVQPLCDG